MNLGRAVLSRRKRLRLTLAQLSRRSGVSRSMLSDVERGKRSPTIKILTQIAEGLGCPVAELLSEPAPRVLRVERAAAQAWSRERASGVERRTTGGLLLERGLEVLWYRLPPGAWIRRGPLAVRYGRGESVVSAPERAGVVEHLTVLEGALTWQAGDRSERLLLGDAASLRVTEEVVLRNDGSEPLLLLCFVDLRVRPGE